MKKDSKQAREAIRWLESQFKQGNRFLRAQSHNEKSSDHAAGANSALKKKDVDAWRSSQLLECCRFFQRESGTADDKRSSMVTVLTNNDPSDPNVDAKLKSLLSQSEQQSKPASAARARRNSPT